MSNEIKDTTPLWWEIQNIPTELIRELRRRNNTNNVGMNIPTPFTSATFDFEQTYNQYKGPMTPWVRIFSNSTGKSINGLVPRSSYLDKKFRTDHDYDGFILKGGDGFYDAFGYQQNKPLKDSIAIIGYEANGNPHYIDNQYRTQYNYSSPITARFPQNNESIPLVPSPAIISVNVKQSKEYITYSSFKFKCFGLAQLEYLTPFFLTAGINVFIEFGWNLFNQKSLLSLSDTRECWDIISKPQTALDRAIISNGNYGCVTGIITKYSFTTNDGFVYDCNVETTSRQGLYAGMKTDNATKISTVTKNDDSDFNKSFLDLKTFIKTYLPLINEVVIQPKDTNTSNFYNYILDKIEKEKDDKRTNDSMANKQQSGRRTDSRGRPIIPNNIIPTPVENSTPVENKNLSSKLFYDGKPEDRIFMGRLEKVYGGKKKRPISPRPTRRGDIVPTGKELTDFIERNTIGYGTVTSAGNISYTQVSCDDDKTDFDSKDGSDEVWMQLDFVFELINLIMSNKHTKQFKIDISDVIINAHPNLISCDKHVLIPNPVSPKVNIGTVVGNTPGKGGYLKGDDAIPASPDVAGNQFLNQLADITVPRNDTLNGQINEKKVEYYELTHEQSYYLACESARKTFKTRGRVRDDIDRVINYLYYIRNPNKSASFPFKKDEEVVRISKDNDGNRSDKVVYKKYYYGYLKHLYISKSKLIDIIKSTDKSNDMTDFKQFINAILKVISDATDNFWKFELQEARDKKGDSVLSIIDTNTVNFEALREIYMFELGRTNNVVRSLNFDVSLTNEQALSVLFGGPNSNNLTETTMVKIAGAKNIDQLNATINNINNIPFLKFNDRMDQYQLTLFANQQSGSMSQSTTPGSTSGIADQNNDITDLQKYGDKSKSEVLCITVKNLNPSYNSSMKEIEDDQRNKRNYKFLCLPSSMRGKLREMLDDNDFKNNAAKYSGVADNFTITLRFDGIFALRNLQCFAISNLPKPYVPGNVVFQVLEVEHTIESGKWETVVSALVRCIGTSKLEYKLV
jgi:hypothetical protein